MSTIRLKVNFKGFKDLEKQLKKLGGKPRISAKTKQSAGRYLRNQIRSDASKGLSPVSGFGRFKRYKNPDRYPGGRKPHRPVNLRLSGDFLRSLSYKVFSKDLVIGYFTAESEAKERGHREGANGQPIRPTIPVRRENFRKGITQKLEDIYKKGFEDLVERTLK